MRNRILTIIGIIALLGAAYWFWPSESATNTIGQATNATLATTNTTTCTTDSMPEAAVRYAGQDGTTAYDLLAADHTVGKDSSGLINAIDGVQPGERQYWAFYVNCELASVGAEQYTSSSSDIIHWQLNSY